MIPTQFRAAGLFPRGLRAFLMTGAGSLGLVSAAAQADCTADTTGTVVTCTGPSTTGYGSTAAGVALTADTTATVTGPILLGNAASVTNSGSLTGTSNTPVVQLGNAGSVVNNGTISLTNSTSGAAAVSLGDFGTVTNNGTLTATAGTSVLQFGQGGTFINTSTAPAAVTGTISFGPNLSGGTSTLNNANTSFGIVGNIYSTGNTSITNSGLMTGSFIQTATGGTVSFANAVGGTFTGGVSTGDVTNLVNAGTLNLGLSSNIGSARFGISSLTNNGTLGVGTTAPTELVVNGAFVNSSTGILNIAIHSSGATAPAAGSSYSQVYAAGPNGTATLGGTLNLVPTAGFYQSGSTYNVVLADQGITGSFATVNGSALPFISFVPVGITTVGSQQAYVVEAERAASYASVLAPVATPSQLAIAGGLGGVVTAANLDPTSTAATLVGQIDLLTIPQTQILLDQINPAPYLALGQAMSDQVNLFSRQLMLRTEDQNSDHSEAGIWAQASDQLHIGSTPADGIRQSIFGGTIGYDLSGPRYVIGAAAGMSSAHLSAGNTYFTGHNNAYMLGAYGAYHLGPLVLTGQLDYDLGSIDATKTLDQSYTTTTTAATTTTPAVTSLTAVATSVDGSAKDHLMKATATLGLDLKARGIKLTPFGGIERTIGAVNPFTETGAAAANLTVGRISVDRTDLLAGLYATASSGQFRPYFRGLYRSQIGSGPDSTVAAFFNGDPTSNFTVAGLPTSRHQVDLDAGVNVVYDDEGGFFVGYQGTYRKGATEHGIQAGFRLQF